MFHDAAEPFAHVVAGDTTNDRSLLIRPSLSEQLPSDCNLKSPLTRARVEAGGCAAASAGHSLGDSKAK